MHANSFLLQLSGGIFHVVLDFPCALLIAKHCYFPNQWVKKSKSTIRENFTFFRKGTFSNLIFTFIAEKKIAKKIYNFFSVHQNCKTKKFAVSKISNKKFRKIHYFAKIKYKRNPRKYFEKNLRRNIFVKKKNFRRKKFDKKIFTKKNLQKQIFVKKKFSEKNPKKI